MTILSGSGILIERSPQAGAFSGWIDTGKATVTHLDPREDDVARLAEFQDDSRDFLLADGALDAVETLSLTLSNWVRVVRPGGRIIIRTPLGGDARDSTLRFVMHEPGGSSDAVSLFTVVDVISHLVELDAIIASPDGCTPGTVAEIVLTKRARPMTPIQSNNSSEALTQTAVARRAIEARDRWRSMDEFNAILETGVTDATVVDLSRLYLMYQWLEHCERLRGDLIEVGTFRGGTAKLMSELSLRREWTCSIHLFDTFDGMPDQLSPDEAGLKGCFADTSLEAVSELLSNNPDAHLYAGIFPESIPDTLFNQQFRFAHIDVDIEKSLSDALDFIYPRLTPGGVLLIDDYGHPECPGATRAVEQFAKKTGETIIQMPLTSSGVIIKMSTTSAPKKTRKGSKKTQFYENA